MKGNDPSLFGALLLSLLVRILLRTQTLFFSRAGLLTLLPGILLSALGGVLFARAWGRAQGRAASLLFAALLIFGAVVEILNLWQLYTAVYPDAVSLLGVCLTVLIPVVYLRRVSAIAQTANVVLGLLAAACALLVVSVAGRLRLVNLQTDVLDAAALQSALAAQCTLYPELLLPALWQDSAKRGRHTVLRLAAVGGVFNIGVHLLLELFFGAAMPQAIDPLHQAASRGNLSIFDRLEWLQLIVWTMAVSVKLGLYLYALTRLTGAKGADENSLHGLPGFAGGAAVLVFLCAAAQHWDMAAAARLQNLAAWAFAALTVLMGGIRWLAADRKKHD